MNSEFNKLMRSKPIVSIFVFNLILHYLIRSFSIIFKDNFVLSKCYQTLDDKSVQCLQHWDQV